MRRWRTTARTRRISARLRRTDFIWWTQADNTRAANDRCDKDDRAGESVTDEMKLHFTKVACSMLRLADTKFLHGCTGRNLDIVAREPLWQCGLDYKHGTGHGIGYILNVHEGRIA